MRLHDTSVPVADLQQPPRARDDPYDGDECRECEDEWPPHPLRRLRDGDLRLERR
jgi:hypothetical protein